MRRTSLILFATLLVLTAIAVSASPDGENDDTSSITLTPGFLRHLAETPEGQVLDLQDGRRVFLRAPVVEGPTFCLAGSEDPRCSEVREIVTSQPCTRPENCRAYQQLLDVTGEPKTELLDRPFQGRLPEPKCQKSEPESEER